MLNFRKKKEKEKCSGDACKIDFNNESSKTDPLGMYTGVPKDPEEKPVQDADDL